MNRKHNTIEKRNRKEIIVMIRTSSVRLTVIDAEAYRQKLTSGGSGIVIIRKDTAQPGIASISTKTGKAVPAKNTQLKLYPQEAFDEAIELTARMPYQKAKKKPAKKSAPAPIEEEVDVRMEEIAASEEYKKIVERYTDKSGKLSYDLLNKDLIKFAHSSSKVRAMVAEGKSQNAIRKYITGTKFRDIAGNYDLSDDDIERITVLLDEVSPKGVYRELNEELRKQLRKAKK